MARFVFELEPVLRQRELVERDRQLEVAELERARVALEDRIRAYQRGITQERTDLRERIGGGGRVELGAVRVQANATLRLAHKAQRAVLELAGIHKQLEAARRRLVEATTARRAIERLRERRLERWRARIKRAEDAELDEIGTTLASRRGGCEGSGGAMGIGAEARR